jgi:hypothetical protein
MDIYKANDDYYIDVLLSGEIITIPLGKFDDAYKTLNRLIAKMVFTECKNEDFKF